MVTVEVDSVTIGPFELDDIPESEINRAVNRRVADGSNPCVRVSIANGSLSLGLITKACAGSGSGTGTHTEQESAILDLWRELVFDKPQVRGGHVVAFLHQVRRLI